MKIPIISSYASYNNNTNDDDEDVIKVRENWGGWMW